MVVDDGSSPFTVAASVDVRSSCQQGKGSEFELDAALHVDGGDGKGKFLFAVPL